MKHVSMLTIWCFLFSMVCGPFNAFAISPVDIVVETDGTLTINSPIVTSNSAVLAGEGSTITNNSTIRSDFSGIMGGYNSVTVNNNGQITSDLIDPGDPATSISLGDNAMVTNTGSVVSEFGTVVSVGDNSTVVNTSTGELVAEDAVGNGIVMGADADLSNAGDIRIDSAGGHGITLGSGAGGDDTLTNTGTIMIGTVGNHGIAFSSGDDLLNNSGSITIIDTFTNGDSGIAFGRGSDELINSGMITIDKVNSTAITFGYGSSDGDDTFTNSGTINIGNASCAGITFAGGDDTFENQAGGVINIGSTGAGGIGFGPGADTFINAGTINIQSSCYSAIGYGTGGTNQADTFTNTGLINIDFAGNSGIDMASDDPDSTDTFTNSGIINIGYTSSNAINLGEGDDTFTNEAGGVITIGHVQGEHGIHFDTGNDSLTNAGTIDIGVVNNAGIFFDSGHATLTNMAGGEILIGSTRYESGIQMEGDTSLYNSVFQLTNAGTIDIQRANCSGIYMDDGLTQTITNSGDINVDLSRYQAIFMGGESSTYNTVNLLTNTGTINIRYSNNAAIDMGDSDAFSNTLENMAGAEINIDYAAYDNAIDMTAYSSDYNSVNLLTNAGTINIGITNSSGIYLEDAGTNTVINNGTITMSGQNDSSIYFYSNSSNPHSENNLTNTGTIDLGYANSSSILMEYGVTQSIDNQMGATIIVDSNADYSAIDMQANTNATYNSTNMLTNAGTIDVGHSCESGIVMEDAIVKNEFINSGTYTMDSSLESGIEMDIYSGSDYQGSENILTNMGTIDIGHANSHGIEMLGEGSTTYNSSNLLTNTGTIDIEFACNGVVMEDSQVNNFDNSNSFRVGSAIGGGIYMDVDNHADSSNTFINSGTVEIGYSNSNSIELSDGVSQTFTNEATGTVTLTSGDYSGIEMDANSTYNSTNLLTNAGTIDISYACNGINLEQADNVLNNTGSIKIGGTPGFGIELDARGTSFAQDNMLTNAGTIEIGMANSNAIELEDGRNNTIDNQAGATITIGGSIDYNGIEMDGNYGDANKVTHTLTNAGTIDIGSTCNGIIMEYGDIEINNSGSLTIAPTLGYGIYTYAYDGIDYTRNDNMLINSGTIDIDQANDNLIDMNQGETTWLDNQAGAMLTLGNSAEGGGIIIDAYNVARLTNAGTIDIGAVNSIGIEVDGDEAYLTNSGDITIHSSAEYEGIVISGTSAGIAELINSGTIDIGSANSTAIDIDAGTSAGNTASLTNMAGGTITIDNGYYEGIYLTGYNTVMLNDGTIEITNYVEDEGLYFDGAGTGSGSHLLTNNGTILINIGDDDGIYMTDAPSTLVNNSSGTITVEGTINDAGINLSNYDDTLTNTGVINISTSSTGIELNGGDDTLTTSGALNFAALQYEAIDGGSDSDTLNLQGTDMLTINGDVINFEFLNKTGTGSWMIDGDVDAYNTATVTAGTLIINGDLNTGTAPEGLYVDVAGTFGGDTDIFGDVVVDGTITPGNSIGTIYIDGDYTQNAGALYEVEVGSYEASDLIEVTGTATIDDGALVDVSSVGYVADGDIFTILDASAGTLSGFYNAAGLSYTSLVLDYAYVDDSDDTVKLAATRTPYSAVGVDGAAAGVGDALIEMAENGVPIAHDILGMVDNLGSASDIEAALGGVAPEVYPSLIDVSMTGSGLFSSVISGRMGNLHVVQNSDDKYYAENIMTENGPVSSRLPAFDRRAEGWSSWGRIVGTTGSQDNDGSLSGYDIDTFSLSFGVDNKINSTCAIGVGFGLVTGDADFTEAQQDTDVDSYYVSLYGTHSNDRYYVDAALVAGFSEYDTSRLPLSGTSVSSSTDGTEWGLMVGGGLYLMDTDTMYFTPTAALMLSQIDIDGFSESGANPLALEVDDYDVTSFKSKIGFRWGGKMAGFEPELRLAWVHEFGDDEREASANFVGTTTKFKLKGAEPDTDSAVLGLGVNFFVNDNMTIFADYDGEFRSDYDAHAVSAGLRYDF